MFDRSRWNTALWARLLCGLLACAAVVGVAPPCRAADPDAEADFFKGKSIDLIVGYGTGGGYDIYARMMAPYLAKALGATVIVRNIPGAGQMIALDRLYAAAPDGLQIMFADGTAGSMAQVAGESGARYDLAKVGYLALAAASPYVWLVTPDSSIKTPADAMAYGKLIRWSSTGPMDGLSDGAAFTCEAIKLDCQVILGYPSSNEAAVAVSKGEMDAIYVSETSAYNYASSGAARPVATMGRARSRFFPDLPTIYELVKLTPEQKWWFDFRSNVDGLGRLLIVPPGMAPARLAFMQRAIKQALTDPDLIADGARTKRFIAYQDPETTAAMATAVVNGLSPEQKRMVMAALTSRTGRR